MRGEGWGVSGGQFLQKQKSHRESTEEQSIRCRYGMHLLLSYKKEWHAQVIVLQNPKKIMIHPKMYLFEFTPADWEK